MAMTADEFVSKIGAEVVAGKIIVGERTGRRIIGDVYPKFELNDEGKALFTSASQDPDPAPAKKGKAAASVLDNIPPHVAGAAQ
jgi:hypothetical protein